MKVATFLVATTAAGLATAAALSSTATTVPRPTCMFNVIHDCNKKCVDTTEEKEKPCRSRCWAKGLARCRDDNIVDTLPIPPLPFIPLIPTSLPVPPYDKNAETEPSTKPWPPPRGGIPRPPSGGGIPRPPPRVGIPRPPPRGGIPTPPIPPIPTSLPVPPYDKNAETEPSTRPAPRGGEDHVGVAPTPAPAPGPDATHPGEQRPDVTIDTTESDAVEMGERPRMKKCSVDTIYACAQGCKPENVDKCQAWCQATVCKHCHSLCNNKGEVMHPH